MNATFFLSVAPEGNLRDFLLSAVAQDIPLYQNESGYAAIPAGEIVEGEWAELSPSDALALTADAEGRQWEARRFGDDQRPFLRFGGDDPEKDLRWLWISADGEIHTDTETGESAPVCWPTIGAAADSLEAARRG